MSGKELVLACSIISLAYATLCAYLLLLGYFVLSPSKREGVRKAAARLRDWARGRGTRWEDSLNAKVRQLIAQERVRCMRSYVHPFMHLLAIAMVALILTPTRQLGCAEPGDEFAVSRLADLLDLVWHLAMCMLFVAFPRLVTPRTIDIAYVFLSAWWIIRVLVVPESDDIVIVMPLTFLQRAVLGLIVCNSGVTSACNVVMMVVQCLARHWHASLTKEGAMQHQMAGYFMVLDIVSTAFIIMVLIGFEQWVWAATRYRLEVKTSSKTEVTVLRLLSALCDAVVTLGSDLRISARAPKLANLLLHAGSALALEGSLFLDHLVETDQARFRQFLAQSPDYLDSCNEPAPAQALNVHMRDSSGVGVQVQLFHSHFQDHNDQVGHLIGICEVGDTGTRHVAGNPQQLAANAAAGRGPSGGAGGIDDDTASTFRGNLDLESDTSLLGDSASVIFASRSADMVAPLRGQADRLQQREVSLTFDSLRFIIRQNQAATPVIDASLLEHESLQQWVTEWGSCRAWIQDLVNAALRPVNATSWPSRTGNPSSLGFNVAFRGTCTLPPDILTRSGITTSAVPSGDVGPPRRLTVSRVKLTQNRLRNSQTPHANRSLSDHSRRSRRHGHHGEVRPNLIGTTVAEAAGTSSSRLPTTDEMPDNAEEPQAAGRACL